MASPPPKRRMLSTPGGDVASWPTKRTALFACGAARSLRHFRMRGPARLLLPSSPSHAPGGWSYSRSSMGWELRALAWMSRCAA
eukprot:10567425-Alexandrium_andersonii.AAC.1